MSSIPEETIKTYFAESVQMDVKTSHLSFVKRDHPSFQKIITLGEDAIILILEEIKRNQQCHPWWRFQAIDEIAKKLKLDLPKINKSDAGRFDPIRRAFILWGEKHKFI